MDNYSLADIASVANDGNMGGNSWIVLIILFAMIFGWGGNGFGRTDNFGQYATSASQQEILFGQQFQNLDNKIDRIGNGIADATFALNNSIKDGNYALQSALSNCCCENQRNTDALRYDMTVQNNAITTAIHAEGEATRNLIQQNKIETLQQKVSQLELNNALGNVVRYPVSTTYNAGYNPFCGCGCGCNA